MHRRARESRESRTLRAASPTSNTMNTKLAAYLTYGSTKQAVFARAAVNTLQRLARPFTNQLSATSAYVPGSKAPYQQYLRSLQGGDALDHFRKVYATGPLSQGGLMRAGNTARRAATLADAMAANAAVKITPHLNDPLVNQLLPF